MLIMKLFFLSVLVLKLTFIKIYFDINYLEELHESFINQIKSFYNIESEIFIEEEVKATKQFVLIKKYEKKFDSI